MGRSSRPWGRNVDRNPMAMGAAMKVNAYVFGVLLALVGLVLSTAGPSRAEDLSQPATLIASEDLDGTALAQTVVIAAPLPGGGHVGFIINRPTALKLGEVLPDKASARAVVDPVYLGGPRLTDTLFALSREAPDDADGAIPLLPDLFVVFDEDSIDRIIDHNPNAARYFVGIFVWPPGELDKEVRAGIWGVKPLDTNAVFRKQPKHLWSELSATLSRSGAHGSWM
jgi:putative transcriptional regulator